LSLPRPGRRSRLRPRLEDEGPARTPGPGDRGPARPSAPRWLRAPCDSPARALVLQPPRGRAGAWTKAPLRLERGLGPRPEASRDRARETPRHATDDRLLRRGRRPVPHERPG